MASQVEIMHKAGFVTAAEAAELIGANHVGTIHRMVKKDALLGERVGVHWYVNAESLLKSVGASPTMTKRIVEYLTTKGIVWGQTKKETTRGKGKRSARE